ncbi:hypothetical protein L1887_12623 [Cichorium endivia]|nr:hypothetical protein L1887_12623 [Cichorium endivia]
MVDSNGIQKELTAEPYEGDSEIAEAWFDQAAEYWKQAIALTPDPKGPLSASWLCHNRSEHLPRIDFQIIIALVNN